ncbi:MAG: pitrilysin family protein, partial [Alphaproteobacteria bacterium]
MSTRVSTLGSRLRVVSDPMDTVETVSVGVWVEVGTRYERPEVNGVSHLLEHMVFKGTERRSAVAIAEEIEAVGGYLNAYTAREHTAYYAKILKEDLALGMDIIADIVQHAVLAPDELARERAVILQEINQAHDTPDDVVFDHFQEAAFPGQALGRPVLGSTDSVRDMGRDTIIEYMRAHYSAPRMVVAAAGRMDHEALVALAETAFEGLPDGDEAPRDAARYVGGEVREDRDLEQVHVVLGFQGV